MVIDFSGEKIEFDKVDMKEVVRKMSAQELLEIQDKDLEDIWSGIIRTKS